MHRQDPCLTIHDLMVPRPRGPVQVQCAVILRGRSLALTGPVRYHKYVQLKSLHGAHTLSNVRLHLRGLLLPARCRVTCPDATSSLQKTAPKSLDCSRDFCNGVFNGVFNRSIVLYIDKSLGDNKWNHDSRFYIRLRVTTSSLLFEIVIKARLPKQPTYSTSPRCD
jgi:hypothetical protein